MSPETEMLVILGQPFLAASNTLINCWDGKIKLTIKNMKME